MVSVEFSISWNSVDGTEVRLIQVSKQEETNQTFESPANISVAGISVRLIHPLKVEANVSILVRPLIGDRLLVSSAD